MVKIETNLSKNDLSFISNKIIEYNKEQGAKHYKDFSFCIRDEEKGTIAWRVKYRDGRVKNFLSPITTQPWGTKIPDFREAEAPSDEMRNSQLLSFEPKYIRMDDGGLHTLESNKLSLKAGADYHESL